MNYPWFYQFPIGVNALFFLAILLACLEASYRVGRWTRSRSSEDREMDRRGDVILTAMLAILGLMLAFTYSYTVSRSDLRKSAVVEEINAIGTAFLRADLLDEPYRATVRTLLLEYTRTLALKSESDGLGNRVPDFTERVSAKQALIWAATTGMAKAQSPDPFTNSMIQSITAIFDAHMRRFKVRLDRLPGEVLAVLVFVAGACLSVAGYSAGRTDSLRRWRTTALTLVLTAVMVMIVDFDRPDSGFVRTSQEGYLLLISEMEIAMGSTA